MIIMSADIKIDCSQMNALTRQLIGSSVYADLVEHFNNPENQKRFRKWKRERKRLEAERKLKEGEDGAEQTL